MTEDELRQRIEEQKQVFNAVTREWLDEKFAKFGRWAFCSILAVIFVLILRVIFVMNASDLRAAVEAAAQVKDLAR